MIRLLLNLLMHTFACRAILQSEFR
jgi:hypothetical protein